MIRFQLGAVCNTPRLRVGARRHCVNQSPTRRNTLLLLLLALTIVGPVGAQPEAIRDQQDDNGGVHDVHVHVHTTNPSPAQTAHSHTIATSESKSRVDPSLLETTHDSEMLPGLEPPTEMEIRGALETLSLGFTSLSFLTEHGAWIVPGGYIVSGYAVDFDETRDTWYVYVEGDGGGLHQVDLVETPQENGKGCLIWPAWIVPGRENMVVLFVIDENGFIFAHSTKLSVPDIHSMGVSGQHPDAPLAENVPSTNSLNHMHEHASDVWSNGLKTASLQHSQGSDSEPPAQSRPDHMVRIKINGEWQWRLEKKVNELVNDPNVDIAFTEEEAEDENPLVVWFSRHTSLFCRKYFHYLDIYHQWFQKYRGKASVTILEIGIQNGGSLEMWREYFGVNATIIGIDIDPRVLELRSTLPWAKIYHGDQTDDAFLRMIARQHPNIDIIIDDGGHKSYQQQTTFEYLFSSVKPNGLYLVEDTETSYDPRSYWRGGVNVPDTFISRAKNAIDLLYYHSTATLQPEINLRLTSQEIELGRRLRAIHFYQAIVIFEKCHPRNRPIQVAAGQRGALDDMAGWLEADNRVYVNGTTSMTPRARPDSLEDDRGQRGQRHGTWSSDQNPETSPYSPTHPV